MTPGTRIAHYEIVGPLGAGGMGTVYRARDSRLGREVALKLLPEELSQDAARRQRFLREARAASAINHPNVCVIHEVGETSDQRLYIAMELVQGRPLDDLLRQRPFNIATAVDTALQVADALDAAHAGKIVHRDIKPANICRTERGLVKVLDFGLAKLLGTETTDVDAPTAVELTSAGQVLGSPAYMSPEQALGKELDHRTDLFSLGVVLYQMVTGRSPFTGSSLAETLQKITQAQPEAMARFNYDVPPELERIVLKCLQKDAGRRFQSARELMVDLGNLKRDLESGAGQGASPAVAARVESSAAGNATVHTSKLGETILPVTASPPEELSRSDVFLSYAGIDDQPLLGRRSGWVSQFCRNLELRLEQLSGERIRIWPHANPAGQAKVDDRILSGLSGIKAMVSVVSPPYAKSESCRQVVEQFWQAAQPGGRSPIESQTRLFKVVKTPVDLDELPAPLSAVFQKLLAFDFFEMDTETGRLREFSEEFGEQARRQFLERIYDLAYEMNRVLRSLKSKPPADRAAARPASVARSVYLAETTSDLRAERDQIRRELQERGFQVLPEAPLPMVAEELTETIRRDLDRSHAVIHLVGARYGMVPEGGNESLVEVQTRLSAEAAPGRKFARFILMPPALITGDDRQTAFVRALREGTAGMERTELLTGALEQLKSLVIKTLTAPPPEPTPVAPATAGELRRVYLICDAKDEQAIEPMEDYLYDQGLEVKIPIFEGDEQDFVGMHQENLKLCDGVIIYFGQASAQWAEMKLMDLLKAQGFGREKPWLSQAVYIAPPDHRRKERFRSHQVDVIRQQAGFDPALLAAFMVKLKAK